jgi:hypothetical protein
MPKPQTEAEKLIQQLQDWPTDDLESLQAMLTGLLETRVQQYLPSKPDGSAIGQRGGRGCIELKTITDRKSGKTFGPYRYLRYRGISKRTGKIALLSVYLGKVASADNVSNQSGN